MEYVSLNSNSLVSNLPPDIHAIETSNYSSPWAPWDLDGTQHSPDTFATDPAIATLARLVVLWPQAASLHGTHEHP